VCYSNDNVLYISGHLPLQPDGTLIKGRIGPLSSGGESIAHGYQAARHAGLNIIATLKQQLGDLDRVQQIIKVRTDNRQSILGECPDKCFSHNCVLSLELQIFGIVQSTDDFKEQHLVMDGCSDVLMQVFGQPVGYHARSAIGTSTLPLDMSVEVEAIVQIKV
jgi:enamine deaminase RidA (YjgF/YER057c/UK114 family)